MHGYLVQSLPPSGSCQVKVDMFRKNLSFLTVNLAKPVMKSFSAAHKSRRRKYQLARVEKNTVNCRMALN